MYQCNIDPDKWIHQTETTRYKLHSLDICKTYIYKTAWDCALGDFGVGWGAVAHIDVKENI